MIKRVVRLRRCHESLQEFLQIDEAQQCLDREDEQVFAQQQDRTRNEAESAASFQSALALARRAALEPAAKGQGRS